MGASSQLDPFNRNKNDYRRISSDYCRHAANFNKTLTFVLLELLKKNEPEYFSVVPPNMTKCPFPLFKDSHPCVCYMNQNMDMFLGCNIINWNDGQTWVERLTTVFGCKTRIRELHVQFKDYTMLIKLEALGNLELTALKISGELGRNYDRRYQVEILTNAFNGSLSTLEEITIGNKEFSQALQSYSHWTEERKRWGHFNEGKSSRISLQHFLT